ncbi:MAG: glycosyltransferase [Acidobacteriaceae bacterium]|nr:glycosyltransferase [Acidobacteriaceae bacterium]
MIANGGNCLAGDVNWSHYVNAAWKPQLDGAPLRYRLRFGLEHRRACFRERVAYRRAKLVICNSEKTRGDVFSCTGGAVADVRTIYLGNDSQYNPVTPAEREAARREMGLRADRKLAAFVGGLGYDNRKGFDVLCQAWAQLSADAGWDADLIVAGSGPSFRKWQQTIGALHLGDRIRLLGFSNNIRSVLASVDVLVSASRYEPYGLNVQEALNRGIPAITTRASGIAERFPGALSPMLIENPNEVADCIRALRYWRARSDELCHEYRVLGRHLSARSWECMAREMVDCIESVEAAGEQRAGSGRRHARPANTGSDCA